MGPQSCPAKFPHYQLVTLRARLSAGSRRARQRNKIYFPSPRSKSDKMASLPDAFRPPDRLLKETSNREYKRLLNHKHIFHVRSFFPRGGGTEAFLLGVFPAAELLRPQPSVAEPNELFDPPPPPPHTHSPPPTKQNTAPSLNSACSRVKFLLLNPRVAMMAGYQCGDVLCGR